MQSGFEGKFIVASNLVDIIAYYVYKILGLPKSAVIGIDTYIDSSRLKTLIGDLLNVDSRSVQAYSMGEHVDSQMVSWSHVYVGGKPFYKVIADNGDRVGNIDLDKLVFDTANAG
jgi:L-lactate dehydrogenase